jgi:uncharacterized membrane protein (DUF106 family)
VMLDLLNTICLKITDPVLGWLLLLPLNLALVIVAVATGAILTFVRLFTTNQDLLGRCAADKKRIKELMRGAKRARDKDAVKRYRATTGVIAMKAMAAEGKPLLAAILPVALLAVWCFARIGYHPPGDGEEVELAAYFPVSAVGKIAHVVPEEGIEVPSGPVQHVEEEPVQGQPSGVARWTVKGKARPEPYRLLIRFDGETREKDLLVGARTYSPVLEVYPDGSRIEAAELGMREFRLFGIVPGIPAILLAPWIVAYLLIAIPFVLILKRVFGIH